MVTIYDVARRAEVSPATVSRVVNGRANVDATLAERVRSAMRELNYRPNAVARNLRRNRTNLWALIIPDIGNPFFTAIVRGVEDVAQAGGYSVVLCNSDNDPGKQGQYVDAALTEHMAGVIISPTDGSDDVTRLLDSHVPVVVVDRQVDGAEVDTVVVDNERGAEVATRHLIESGYARIACVTGPADVFTAERRLAGYRRALTAAGRSVDLGLIRYADFGQGGGYRAMSSLLSSAAAPDAVFVTNNLMTLGAVECLLDRGLTVPDDVGLIGFDDLPWVNLLRPALSSVAQPTYELGRNAADLLAARILNPQRPPSTVILPTRLRIRDSSIRPARG